MTDLRFCSACLAAVFIVVTVLNACVEHDFGSSFIVECEGLEEISYVNEVKPILEAKCNGCHNAASPGIPDWNTFSNLQLKGREIQERITLPLTDSRKMPRQGNLSDEERQTLYCWIEQGTQNN